MNSQTDLREVISAFCLEGQLEECVPYGNGHINDTYRVTFQTEQGIRRYILQKMSQVVFKKPVELMENVSKVTSWLCKKITENGGDPERETLNLVNTKTGMPWHSVISRDFWQIIRQKLFTKPFRISIIHRIV